MKRVKTIPQNKEKESVNLYTVLNLLVNARDSTTHYLEALEKLPEDGRQKKLGEVQEKINGAMVDIAHVIGLEVLNQVETESLNQNKQTLL